jgi:hypothetical protein
VCSRDLKFSPPNATNVCKSIEDLVQSFRSRRIFVQMLRSSRGPWATGERHRRHHHLGTHVICYHQLQLGTHVELHQLSVGRLCTFCRTCTCIHPHLYESKEREFAAARPPNEHDGRARFRIAHAMYGRSFGPVEQRPHLFGWDRKLMTVKPRFPFLAALS